jgi:hypothetical protein
MVEASTFLFQCRESDEAFSTNVLIEGCKQTADAIRNLSTYRDAMSSHAAEALERFQTWWKKTTDLNLTGFKGVMALTAVLAAFRSEFDHHLADHEAIVRNRVARAFLHLKRSLVADQDIRRRWEDAFAQGETACEKLGALHLLSHGILSFKANAEGERTDLILGERLVIDDAIIAATDGLVLTEWKLVKTGDSAEERRRIAKSQAQLYSVGSLAGFELRSERYIVLIGEQELQEMPDDREGTVLYKTISIALSREIPSKAAAHSRARNPVDEPTRQPVGKSL